MPVLIGGALGCMAGLGAWLVARHLAGPKGASLSETPGSRLVLLLLSSQGNVPLLAALTMAGMAAWGAYMGWRVPYLNHISAAVALSGLLLAISLVDLAVRRVPNVLVLALLLWAAVQVLWLGQPAPLAAMLGLVTGGGVFLLAAWLGRGAMGGGDVKLAAALGAVLGFPLVMPGLLCGVLAGGLAALILLLTRRAGRKDTMAYAPYLALGALIVWTRSMELWP